MSQNPTMREKLDHADQEAGRFFNYMADFVGFTTEQAAAIFESRFIIEKHIPNIVAQFYDHLLRYPPTRQVFLKADGSLDEEYVQMRMGHLANFWRRTANGPYDDEYARYIDYVGRAHTRRGADPKIDIPERYVIGQVGFIQHAITEAISQELHDIDPEWELRALKAWNLLMMVLLELLARVYNDNEESIQSHAQSQHFDPQVVKDLSVNAYEQGLGMQYLQSVRQPFYVAETAEIPLGSRKIIQLMGKSIGVFHHASGWYAVLNHCLHAGGPVAEGRLHGDILVCPWHGYQYELPSGTLRSDSTAKLEMFPVELHQNQVFVILPIVAEGSAAPST